MTNAQTNLTAANASNVTTLPLPEYLNVKGVSALTGMSVSTIRAATYAGELKARKVGRSVMVKADDARKWMDGFPTYVADQTG